MTLAGIFICLVLAAPEPPKTWGLQLDGKPAKDLQEVSLCQQERVLTFDSSSRLREKKAVYRPRDIRCSLAEP